MKKPYMFSRRLFCLANLSWLLPTSALAGVSEATVPRRLHSVTGLKKEKADYYIKLHAKPWPSILQRIKDSNIRNYSVAVKEIDGKLFLFSYFEYIGNDFEGDMAKIAADPETQRWWKETDPCQIPLPDAKAQGKIWSDALEVFHAS